MLFARGQLTIISSFGAIHALIVLRGVLLPKQRLEVLDTVRTTVLPFHYCFLISEHLTESTNRCYNNAASARTTLAYT